MPRRPLLLVLWTLFALYPDPRMLGGSIARAWSPPIEPEAVRALAATLPDDGRAIEAYVNDRLIAYAVPWQTHAVPWYYPTVAEALERGTGDCQARAIVLASILGAKGIPARLVGSMDHLWVDYPGKRANTIENDAIALATQKEDGRYELRWPRLVEWRTSWEIERAYFWDAMPGWRVALLAAGWLVISLSRYATGAMNTFTTKAQRSQSLLKRIFVPFVSLW